MIRRAFAERGKTYKSRHAIAREFADKFGTSKAAIFRIWRGDTFSGVKSDPE